MSSTPVAQAMTDGAFFSVCEKIFNQYPELRRTTAWGFDKKDQIWIAEQTIHLSYESTVLTLYRDSNGMYRVRTKKAPSMLYLVEPDKTQAVDESQQIGEDFIMLEGVPQECAADLEQAVPFPCLAAIYGLLADDGIVTAYIYATAKDDYELDCMFYFNVLLERPIAPELTDFDIHSFWSLFKDGRLVRIDTVLTNEAEFWHLSIGNQGYEVWYPGSKQAAAHPELPADAVYANYAPDSCEEIPIITKPSHAEIRKIAVSDEDSYEDGWPYGLSGASCDITARVKRTSAYNVTNYDEYRVAKRTLDDSDE